MSVLLEKDFGITDLISGMHSWADLSRPVNPRLFDCFKHVWKEQGRFIAYGENGAVVLEQGNEKDAALIYGIMTMG